MHTVVSKISGGRVELSSRWCYVTGHFLMCSPTSQKILQPLMLECISFCCIEFSGQLCSHLTSPNIIMISELEDLKVILKLSRQIFMVSSMDVSGSHDPSKRVLMVKLAM